MKTLRTLLAEGAKRYTYKDYMKKKRAKVATQKQAEKTVSKPSAPEQREKRRAAHWRRTGVSDTTVSWMKKGGWL